MIKTLISLIAAIAFLTANVSAEKYTYTYGNGTVCDPNKDPLIAAFMEQDAKTTTGDIEEIYNSTCIRTDKWEYFFVEYHDEELGEYNDVLIEVTKVISKKNKIAKGNIYYP